MKHIAWIIAFFCLTSSALATDVPALVGPVNDYAKVLTDEQVKILSARLLNNEHQTTDQVVVLLIPTLNGQDIESYAHDVFHTWGLGAKKEVNKPGDNGILMVVAVNDHKMRIEVGYGMEGSLTDGACGQIIRNTLAPAFKQNNFYQGVTDGVSQIEKAISGQPLSASLVPPPPVTAGSALNNIGGGWIICDIILIIVLLIVCMASQHPPTGGFIGGVGAFLIAIFIFSFGIAIIVGIVGAVVGFIAACIDPDSIGSGSSGGGWDSGSSSSSDSGSSYSGGGGDSGGGGASDSW